MSLSALAVVLLVAGVMGLVVFGVVFFRAESRERGD